MYANVHRGLGITCCCTTKIEALVLVSGEASKSPNTPNSGYSVRYASACV